MAIFRNISINDLRYNYSPKKRDEYINQILQYKNYDSAIYICLNPDYEKYITVTQENNLFKLILESDNSEIIKRFLSERIYVRNDLPSNLRKIIIPLICKITDGSIIKEFFEKIKFKLEEDDLKILIKKIKDNVILQNQNFIFETMKKYKSIISETILELFIELLYNLKNVKMVYFLLIVREFKDKLTTLSIMYILLKNDEDEYKSLEKDLMIELSSIVDKEDLIVIKSNARNIGTFYKCDFEGILDENIISVLNSTNIDDIYMFLRINHEKLERHIYYQIVHRLLVLSKRQKTSRNIILLAIYMDRSLINLLYEDNAVNNLYVYISESDEFTKEEKDAILKQLITSKEKKFIYSPVEDESLIDRFNKYRNN